MRRKKPTALTATFGSLWAERPVSAVNPKARTSFLPFSSILVMILLAAGALGISAVVSGHDRLKDARSHNVKVKQEVDQLNDEIHRLNDENKAMVSDPKVIEHMIREQYGMIKRGELSADTTIKAGNDSTK
jgi:cell division protein FtsB